MERAPFGLIRQVSKSTLSQRSGASPLDAENPTTQRAKFAISYDPGVHAGSDSSTEPVPSAVNRISTSSDALGAGRRSNVTVYATVELGAETESGAAWP